MTAKIKTTMQVSSNVDGLDLDGLFDEDDLRIIAETGLALLKLRITTRSERADGTRLSRYSRVPISVPVLGIGTGSPMLRPSGGRLSKSGKTMRFQGGYEAVRASAGRSTVKDLTLSGNLMGKRFRVLRVEKTLVVVGWPAGSTQAVAAHGLNEQENGVLFLWSDAEQNAMLAAAEDHIQEYFARRGWANVPGISITE